MWRFCVCLVLLVPVVGCDGHTSLKGEVVGPDDKPIAGAMVKLFESKDAQQGGSRTDESITDEFGQFSVALTHAPFDIPLVVTVAKEGYKPFRKEFKVRQREGFPRKIVLDPAQRP